MIHEENRLFRLATKNTSWWFCVTEFGHMEHIHYGERLAEDQDPEGLRLKRTAIPGSSVLYSPKYPNYCLDTLCLEWSGIGRGDYRHSPAELKMPDGSFSCDFVYRSFRVFAGSAHM